MTTALLLINPNARSGNSNLDEALKQLAERGIRVIDLQAESREGVSDEIIKHSAEASLVIVGGGDGSVNAAIRGVMQSGLTLAVLPLGTANDFARTLKIPANLSQAVDAIAEGRTAAIDVGQVNDSYFFNVAHVGLAVDIARSSDDTEKKFLSVFAYVLAMYRALKRNRRFKATIECDGKTIRTRCNHISVGNGRNYGGGMVITEKARIDDGLLDTFTWQRRSLLRLLWAGVKMRSGRHVELKEVHQITGRNVKVTTGRWLPVAADGEILETTPATFCTHPKAIQAIVGTDFIPSSS